MDEIFESLKTAFLNHWSKVVAGAVFMVVGWLIGWWRSNQKWKRKEFYERINFSLNSLHDGKLRIRTLLEKSSYDVFLNQVAVQRLLDSSAQTTVADPIVPLPKDDYWFYLNAALNEISEKFAEGFVRRDVGLEHSAHRYVLCLTNECDGHVRNRKIRALLILESDLVELPEEMPDLESPNHSTRWETLKIMAEQLKSSPHKFIKIELVLSGA